MPLRSLIIYILTSTYIGSSFSAVDHRLHRLRRQPLNLLFSKASIIRLEPTINSIIENLCRRLDEFKKSGQPVPVRLAYQCLATDVVTLYSFNKSWNYLDDPEFAPKWCETVRATADMGHTTKQFPWLFPILEALPDSAVAAVFPGMLLLLNWRRVGLSCLSHL
jgi:hypothetical protein